MIRFFRIARFFRFARPPPPRVTVDTATAYCLLSPVSYPPPVPNHPARNVGTSSRYSKRKVGRAVPVTPLRGMTGEPHTGFVPPPPPIPPPIRHCGNCPRVARTFLSAHVHEGRQKCLPHTARSITAASRDGFAPPVPARFCRSVTDTRRQSTTIEACYRRRRH
jgi:hypothetical protein